MPYRPLIPLFAAIAALSVSARAVDYVREIKPLLKTHCVKCHGGTTQKGQLRLDTAAAALQGGGRGKAIIPGDGKASLLVGALQGTHSEIPQMPYKRGPLDSAQIARVQQWIDEGANAPADEKPSDDRHWAYIAPVRPALPQAAGVGGNPIDTFIRRRLEEEGLQTSAEATPETLMRRLHLDLTGLPPTPEEVAAFAKSHSESDIGALVDRLLASEHYGERWGRWWLDQARYADSNGYSIDAPRSIWPYRDWVVAAMNRNMTFDQFSVEQLAGDMLPNATREQTIATGFHRNTQINQEGGIDKEQFRIESVFDRVATTGTVWLGLTIGCAQCHDHKFDAISHQEYYGFFAFLNNQEEPTLSVPDPDQDLAKLKHEQKKLEDDLAAYMQKNQAMAKEWENDISPSQKAKLSKEAQKALGIPVEKRKLAQSRVLFNNGPGAADQAFRALNEALTELDRLIAGGVTTLVMKELPKPRKTTLFTKGDFTRPAEEVKPGVLAVLPKMAAANPNRLDLAKWLVSRDNPLTARVIVNRVWQQYFGKGLVETENDFGTMGTLPSHPELLDWLAVEFMESGWDLKHTHRLIVTSKTYQQSSGASVAAGALAENVRRDPNNHWLWRQNRLRLDAEIVRDVCLTASGLLAQEVGGPPVYPPIPEGVLALGQVKRSWPLSKGRDRYRRGLYTFIFRATPPPAMNVFDAPDGFSTCTKRLRSNTPLQALTMLNDAAFVEFAQSLSEIVKKEGIEVAFKRCTARAPAADEVALLRKLQPAEMARVLLNLDETITRE